MRCQSSETCENPVAYSCDECGHLVCGTHREVVFAGLEDHVVCMDCRPAPPTEQLELTQTELLDLAPSGQLDPARSEQSDLASSEQLSLAPTELLNFPRPEEFSAGPRTAGPWPVTQFAESAPVPAPAPTDAAPADAEVPDAGPGEVPTAAPPLFEAPVQDSPHEDPRRADPARSDDLTRADLIRAGLTPADSSRVDSSRVDAVPADSGRAESGRTGPSRAQTRRERTAAPVPGTPHRRALRRQPEVPARGRLKDDTMGPLVILAVLCAIVAVVGGVIHNSFLGLGGGLISGAAVIAIIIIGLTSPK